MNKRFELTINSNGQCDIVDWAESKEKNAICIYNDLGNYYFSSAKALCELLNELNGENKELKRENEDLNSQLIRLDKELFCQDCFTCRHSKSININVECAEGEKEYHRYCDFYEISDEWVE